MPGFITDPVFDTASNALIHFHCTSRHEDGGPEGKRLPFTIRTQTDSDQGVALEVEMPIGQPVTCAKFINLDTMLISTGKIFKVTHDELGCRTQFWTEGHRRPEDVPQLGRRRARGRRHDPAPPRRLLRRPHASHQRPGDADGNEGRRRGVTKNGGPTRFWAQSAQLTSLFRRMGGNTMRTRIPWGRIIAGTLAIVLLGIGVWACWTSCQSRAEANAAATAEPIRLDVDLSKPGEYWGEFHHTFAGGAHGENLGIEAVSGFAFAEAAAAAIEGIAGSVEIIDPGEDKVVWRSELTPEHLRVTAHYEGDTPLYAPCGRRSPRAGRPISTVRFGVFSSDRADYWRHRMLCDRRRHRSARDGRNLEDMPRKEDQRLRRRFLLKVNKPTKLCE